MFPILHIIFKQIWNVFTNINHFARKYCIGIFIITIDDPMDVIW